jgi:hypothetical protein
MAGLKKRLELIEVQRRMGETQPTSEALRHLSGEDLKALEESLLAEARARGERPSQNNPFIEEFAARETEVTAQQRRHAEESRRRDRELLERNRALI